MTPNEFGFKVLNWLLDNGDKKLEPERWAALLGIRIIDWDGFRNNNHQDEIGLMDFMKRIKLCTILPLK